MITFAPRTFTVSRLTSLCRQRLVNPFLHPRPILILRNQLSTSHYIELATPQPYQPTLERDRTVIPNGFTFPWPFNFPFPDGGPDSSNDNGQTPPPAPLPLPYPAKIDNNPFPEIPIGPIDPPPSTENDFTAPGLSSSQATKDLQNQPMTTIKSFSHKSQFSEGVLRNKIERARLAELRRHGLI